MKILILSANTGNGHNAAAQALTAQLGRLGAVCETLDALSLISPRTSRLVSIGHNYLYRHHPHLFGVGYRFEEQHKPRLICQQCARGAEALEKHLAAGGFDAVIAVHVFAALMLTALRREGKRTPPAYFVATDYTCSPGVSETQMDGYFIPHRLLTDEFLRAGIDRRLLFPTGIPIADAFYNRGDRSHLRPSLGIGDEHPVVLLSCGSMGCGKLERHAVAVANALPAQALLQVLCGRNQRLQAALSALGDPRIRPVGFTDRMPAYLSVADLYITKAGGLSVSEALAMQTPMICVDVIRGLETRNFDFLIQNGVAAGVRKWSQLPALIKEQLSHPHSQITETSKAFLPPNAAQAIADHVIRSIPNKK